MGVGSVGSTGSVPEVQKPAAPPVSKEPALDTPAVKVSLSAEAQKMMGGDVDHDGDSH